MAALPRSNIEGGRPELPKFPVWSPDGDMEMHIRQNINDLVRHNGWSLADPRKSPKLRPDAEPAPISASEAKAALPKLDALRLELLMLGGTVDATWGVKKLETSIAALQAAKAAPASDAAGFASFAAQSAATPVKTAE